MVNPIDVTIRSAVANDVGFLATAHRYAHTAVQDERGGKLDILLRGRPEPIEESFEATIADPTAHVLVAEADRVAVGYLVCELTRLRNGELLASVDDLWVHPEARGVGAGAALMRAASDHAIEAGCVGIDARALPGDRVTKNFFESFGLVARTIEVHKTL